MGDEPRNVEFVGFQQFREVSRVFVRLNDPGKFRVTPHDGVVTLTLENTNCTVANNLRHLDTHLFEGPVLMIQPKLIEGSGTNSVDIDIYLRRSVKVTPSQKDNIIMLDFPR